MRGIKKEDFIKRYENAKFSVQDMRGIGRLKKLDAAKADINKDGQVQGPDEIEALFDQVARGNDSFDTWNKQRALFGVVGPLTQRFNRKHKEMAALDNLAAQRTNPPAGETGHDPFQREKRLTRGNYRGESLDINNQRSAQRLSPTEAAKYGAQPGEIAFSNFSHDGKFWVAIVPPNSVEDIDMLLEHFPAIVPAAHSMLRFRLKPDQEVRLVPQVIGDTTPPTSLKDLLLSIEAIGPKGFKYDLVDGIFNNFGTAYRMVSLDDRAKHAKRIKHRVEQIPMRLTPEAKQKILTEAIDTATANGLKRSYNTLTRNCTNEAFHIIDRGIGNSVPPHIHFARAITAETLPTNSRTYLRIRGLLDRKRTRPDVADELRASNPSPV